MSMIFFLNKNKFCWDNNFGFPSYSICVCYLLFDWHDHVMIWKWFPYHCPFCKGIPQHTSGFSSQLLAWASFWINSSAAGDYRGCVTVNWHIYVTSWYYCKILFFATVKPVYNDHPVGQANMIAQDRWSQTAGRHGSQPGTQNRLCCRHSWQLTYGCKGLLVETKHE